MPDGKELALLIDPARESGVDHIQFRPMPMAGRVRWLPVARNGSEKGEWTIRTCQLARDDLLDLYTAHVDLHVRPAVNDVRNAVDDGARRGAWTRAVQLLNPRMPLTGLSFDVLDDAFPEAERARLRLTLHVP